MPESKKRKPKRNRARQRLAARDGERIKIVGCCPDLEMEIGVGKLNVRHNDDCPALHPSATDYIPARLVANAATADALSRRGLGPVAVVIAGGGRR